MTTKVIKCKNCNIVICEVLAFVQNKMDVMDEESLVRLCVSAFSAEDIESAKRLLFESISTTRRKITRRKDGKSQRDLYDVIAVLKEVDPEEVPIFVAKELQKLPPVTFDHIDATRLLKDLLVLQNELRIVKDTYVTVKQLDELKNKLANCKNQYQSSSENCDLQSGGIRRNIIRETVSGTVTDLPQSTETSREQTNEVELCEDLSSSSCVCNEAATVLLTQESEKRVEAGTTVSTNEQCVEHAQARSNAQVISGSGSNTKTPPEYNEIVNEWHVVQKKRPNYRFAGCKGRATIEPNNKFRAADIKTPLFITNVDKQTQESDIVSYIMSKTQTEVILKKIDIKKDRNYNAYKILVPQQKLDLFLNDGLWPEGISFRRFIYFKKNKDYNVSLKSTNMNGDRKQNNT